MRTLYDAGGIQITDEAVTVSKNSSADRRAHHYRIEDIAAYTIQPVPKRLPDFSRFWKVWLVIFLILVALLYYVRMQRGFVGNDITAITGMGLLAVPMTFLMGRNFPALRVTSKMPAYYTVHLSFKKRGQKAIIHSADTQFIDAVQQALGDAGLPGKRAAL